MRHDVLAALAALLTALPVLANPLVPKPGLLPRWERSGAGADVDYSDWAAFLDRYRSVGDDGIARIAYGKVSWADRGKFYKAVLALEDAPVNRMTRPQQLAYWINLYNAVTVRTVLRDYPVSTIRKLGGDLLNQGPWHRPVVSVEGKTLSLNDIEHRIVRPIYNDVRIHFALNCAALGCPNLAAVPFEAERLDAQLDVAARDFVNHPRGLRLEKGKLTGSSIFDWYAVDFGGPERVVAFARRYADDKTLGVLQGRTRIERFSYDWKLNDRR